MGGDGQLPYSDAIGPHRPYLLDSSMGMVSSLGLAYGDGATLATWEIDNRVVYVRVRNPRAFQPTHGYIWSGAASVGARFDVGWYLPGGERFGSLSLQRQASTGATEPTVNNGIQLAPLIGASQQAVVPAGEVILAMMYTEGFEQVGFRTFPSWPPLNALLQFGQDGFVAGFLLASPRVPGPADTPGGDVNNCPVFGLCSLLV